MFYIIKNKMRNKNHRKGTICFLRKKSILKEMMTLTKIKTQQGKNPQWVKKQVRHNQRDKFYTSRKICGNYVENSTWKPRYRKCGKGVKQKFLYTAEGSRTWYNQFGK